MEKEEKTQEEIMLEQKRIECAWCGAPHAKLWDTYADCALFVELLKG